MKTFTVTNRGGLSRFFRDIEEHLATNGPFSAVIGDIEQSRSNAQNRLAWLWYTEAAEQRNDDTPDGYRAICKLHCGVAILKERDAFRNVYDRIIKPLTYEQKIECMKEPISFPITSQMNVKEMARYLESVEQLLSVKYGVELSKPDDLYNLSLGLKKKP